MIKNLVCTACTSKMSTTLKAYISAIFSQNSIKLQQGGPLDLKDFKSGQKFGLYQQKMSDGLMAYDVTAPPRNLEVGVDDLVF